MHHRRPRSCSVLMLALMFALAFALALALALATLLLCASTAAAAATPVVTLQPNFTQIGYTTRTHTTLQGVVNPLMRRDSPIHDAAFDALAAVRADYVRFQGWYPYPKLVVAELDEPSGTSLCGNVAVGYNVTLSCAARQPGQPNGVIAKIAYASFGAPSGRCLSFSEGSCFSANTSDIVAKICVGQRECSVPASPELFGQPCPSEPSSVRLAVQVVCDPPQNHTYWDFSYLNPLMEDAMAATDGYARIVNLCTWPKWMFNVSSAPLDYYPDDPNTIDWNYVQGSEPRDPTGDEFGAYFARLAAYYTQGGMTDEYSVFHASPYQYDIQLWEVLNEVDFQMSVATYTRLYDSVVRQIRECCDPHRRMQFVGLALANANPSWFSYFLNQSHHEPDTPLDWVSFHHYGLPASRVNVSTFEIIFDQADEFLERVVEYDIIRASLSPSTRTTLNEVGAILPNDNVPSSAMFPPIYLNAVSAMFAYMYVQVLPLGIDAIGSSQLIGYPELAELGLEPQFPSVTMLNWTTGAGTARYFMVQMLLDHFAPGDSVVNMTVSVSTSARASERAEATASAGGTRSGPAAQVRRPVMAVAFAARSAAEVEESRSRTRALPSSLQSNRVLVINTINDDVSIVLPVDLVAGDAYGFVVDEESGESPARRFALTSNKFQLAPFAVAVIVLPVSAGGARSQDVVVM